MKVAVLTLTRDRLDYSKECFQKLRDFAGCEYDHLVLDQGSEDGTPDWLRNEYAPHWLELLPGNIGICPALNILVDRLTKPYDVVVRFDNDCEVFMGGTLEGVCRVAMEHNTILAPKVLGLRSPPVSPGTFSLGEHVVDETGILGGAFMAIPATVFNDFRFDEKSPPWGGDEYVTSWFRERGGRCGYLRPWEVWHRTDQHWADYPGYYQRKINEGMR